MESPEIVAAIGQPKLGWKSQKLNVGDHQIGLGRRAVGDDGTLHVRNDRLHIRLVQAQHGGAVKRDAIDELRENFLNPPSRVL